tara:strand:- start:91 stop:216 length:126 start_codon:yes stop_codon:yes gene_type:complete
LFDDVWAGSRIWCRDCLGGDAFDWARNGDGGLLWDKHRDFG